MQCVRSHWPTKIIIFWGPQPMCTEHADGMFVGPSQSSYFTSNMYYTTNSGKGWILNLIQGTGIFYPQDVWYRKQCWPVKRQPYKMVKHSNNSSAFADELCECAWPFLWVGTESVKRKFYIFIQETYDLNPLTPDVH